MSDPKRTCPCGCERSDETPKLHGMNLEGQWWCPRGFVHTARHEHPGRFQNAGVKASRCGSCGYEVIDLGTSRCSHCTQRLVIALPPVQVDTEAAAQAARAS